MVNVLVVKGNYKGRIGMADFTPSKYGNVMFYPQEGSNPYRVCLKTEDVVVIKGE